MCVLTPDRKTQSHTPACCFCQLLTLPRAMSGPDLGPDGDTGGAFGNDRQGSSGISTVLVSWLPQGFGSCVFSWGPRSGFL